MPGQGENTSRYETMLDGCDAVNVPVNVAVNVPNEKRNRTRTALLPLSFLSLSSTARSNTGRRAPISKKDRKLKDVA